MAIRLALLCLLSIPMLPKAYADTAEGLHFSHNDWQLVCDNTRTCRAAGYSTDGQQSEQELPVSILLTRAAGPDQPVSARVQLGSYDTWDAMGALPEVFDLTMHIDGEAVGQVAMRYNVLVADLPEEQVAALLEALTRDSDIQWTAGNLFWRLSDRGSAAVLLKMDEFQGRLGTIGALYRPGTESEDDVLPALEVPIVVRAPVEATRPGDARFVFENSEAIRTALRATVDYEDCPALTDEDGALSASRLSDAKLIISTRCWLGAYNASIGYWVIDDTAPFKATLVTDSGTHYDSDGLHASHKGRGLGDCIYLDSWTWDGEEFIHTDSRSTGMCRLIAPGGPWSLPTIVTDVRYSPVETAAETPDWTLLPLDAHIARLSADIELGGKLYCRAESSGERHWFDSCDSFSALRERGCAGETRADVQFETSYAALCAEMEALKNAEEAETNYFGMHSAYWWTEVPAEVIPISSGMYTDEVYELVRQERDAMVTGKTLDELAITEITYEIHEFTAVLGLLEMDCGEIRNRLVLRALTLADFDGDGIMDLVVQAHRAGASDTCQLGYGNSLGGESTTVLSKAGPDQPIVIVEVPGID